MFAARKARKAFGNGQRAYSELASHGNFEGSGTLEYCLILMRSTNPYPVNTPLHERWEDGWRQQAGLRRVGTESTGAK